jgi:hypothetical protein
MLNVGDIGLGQMPQGHLDHRLRRADSALNSDRLPAQVNEASNLLSVRASPAGAGLVLTTLMRVPSGRLRCAAVSPSGLYVSPLAVRPPPGGQPAAPEVSSCVAGTLSGKLIHWSTNKRRPLSAPRIRGCERSRRADYPILLVEARRFDPNWSVILGEVCHLPDSAVGQLHLNFVVSYTDNCNFGSDTGRHLDFYFGSRLDWTGRASRDRRSLY